MPHLYYTNATKLNFTAEIVALGTHAGRLVAILDRSYFYPTSGGQPHDTGSLLQGDSFAKVIDVVEREGDAVVLHIIDRPLQLGRVTGEIDRERRRDHMQHHTGQHILSAAFLEVAGAATIGFHLSAQSVTIDLDRAELPAETIDAAESLANEIVLENRPVTVRFVDEREAASLSLRKTPPGRDGLLRLVEIADFDLCACGGTHVAHTGEVGLIKIAGVERRGSTTRVEFLCGGRALADYRQKQAIVKELCATLTTGATELPPALLRLQEENKELRHEVRRREAALLALEAEKLLAAAEQLGAGRLVAQLFVDRPADELRRLATLIAEAGSAVALLGLAGERAHLVYARSTDTPWTMNELIKPALASLGGRGGGNAALAQGGGPAAGEATLQSILESSAATLRGS